MESCREIAARRFGIQKLWPEQEAAMAAVLSGRDALVVLPTGFGKSLIYQVPSLLFPRPTVVISPLIALMVDQQRALQQRGMPVIRLDSSVPAADRRAALERLQAGGPLVVLTTPETLESAATGPLLEAARPALLAVDEAHCISEWGHDFRPSYLRLVEARARLGNPPALALTATATPKVKEDIAQRLGLRDPLVASAPPHRENLFLSAQVVPGNMKPEAAAKVLKRLPRPGIVYCATTVEVDSIWRALNRAQIPAARYHGKLAAIERGAAQKRFMKPSKRILMVATSAFGMGIDKRNIRYILHYQAPGSLEQYVQESGRAGRDGLASQCILLFDPADLETQRFLQKQSRPAVHQLVRVAEALKAWAEQGRAVDVSALALSAQVPARTCASLVTELSDAGLAEQTPEGVRATVPPAVLEERAKDLAGRLETLRREDEKRLRLVADYATTDDCRSAFIRRYFGEESPPNCGRCDRCKANRIPPPEGSVVLEDTAAEAPEEREPPPRRQPQQPGGGRRRRRRRRRGRERGQGQAPPATGAPVAAAPAPPPAPRPVAGPAPAVRPPPPPEPAAPPPPRPAPPPPPPAVAPAPEAAEAVEPARPKKKPAKKPAARAKPKAKPKPKPKAKAPKARAQKPKKAAKKPATGRKTSPRSPRGRG